jgi:TolB protein
MLKISSAMANLLAIMSNAQPALPQQIGTVAFAMMKNRGQCRWVWFSLAECRVPEMNKTLIFHRRWRNALVIVVMLLILLGIGVVLLVRPEMPPSGSLLISVEENIVRRWILVDIATGTYHDWADDIDVVLPAGSSDLQISPDRRQIAFPVFDAPSDTMRIFLVNADGSNLHPISAGDGRDHSPQWSPDSRTIVFSRSSNYLSALFLLDVATQTEEQITAFTNDIHANWSPDGARIVFTTSRDGFQELYSYEMASGESIRLTRNELQNDLNAAFSPDGRHIAYMSNYSVGDGTGEIWVMDADGTNQQRITDNEVDDVNPVWTPDSRAIVFTQTSSDRTGGDLWRYWIQTGESERLTNAGGYELAPVFSADSNYMAYITDIRGRERGLDLLNLRTLESKPLFAEENVRVWFISRWMNPSP